MYLVVFMLDRFLNYTNLNMAITVGQSDEIQVNLYVNSFHNIICIKKISMLETKVKPNVPMLRVIILCCNIWMADKVVV